MATNGGEERKGEAVTAILRARSVAGFAIVHGAVALFLFLVLEGVDQCAEPFNQCMEACPVLTLVEFYTTQFLSHPIVYATMTVCSVVQMLAAALVLVSTGRPCLVASFVMICVTVATGVLSIRLIYTAMFGSHCCFSGGIVQVASAVVVALSLFVVPFWGGFFISYERAHAHLP